LATVFGVGRAPVAPGTFGSAAGVILFLLLSGLSPVLYAVTLVGVTCLAIWAAEAYERQTGAHDDGRIVIDEVTGQLVALTPLVLAGRSRSFFLVVTGFVLFRVFDVWKPGPIRWLDRNVAGGAGVVLDDVLAGGFAAALLAGVVAVTGFE